MKQELTVGELYLAREGVKRVMEAKLPIKAGYWLGRTLEKLNAELKDADKKREELFKELGEEKNGNYVLPREKTGEFMVQFKEVNEEKMEVDIQKIKLSVFADKDVDATGLGMMMPFVEDDTE